MEIRDIIIHKLYGLFQKCFVLSRKKNLFLYSFIPHKKA